LKYAGGDYGAWKVKTTCVFEIEFVGRGTFVSVAAVSPGATGTRSYTTTTFD